MGMMARTTSFGGAHAGLEQFSEVVRPRLARLVAQGDGRCGIFDDLNCWCDAECNVVSR